MLAEPIYKVYKAQTKLAEDGIIVATISTEDVDRDGEIVRADAMREALADYMRHPVLLASHDYLDLRQQIGEIVSSDVADGRTVAKIRYYSGMGNEVADWAHKLAGMGKAAYSIGFAPREWIDGHGAEPRRTFTKLELLEVSHVTIPSNRGALAGVRQRSSPVTEPLTIRVVMGALQDHADQLVMLHHQGWALGQLRLDNLGEIVQRLQGVLNAVAEDEKTFTGTGPDLWFELARKAEALKEGK